MIPLLLAALLAVPATPTATADTFGAAALVNTDIDWATIDHVDYITPAPAAADFDYTAHGGNGCTSTAASGFVACTEGHVGSDRHVILAGDSKTSQWHPAVSSIATRTGWELTTTSFAACPLTAALLLYQDDPYDTCAAWTVEAVDFILAERPDLLIVSGGRSTAYPLDGTPADVTFEALVDGYASLWQRFVDAGIQVLVVVNNGGPAVGHEIPDCVMANPDHLSACTFDYVPLSDAPQGTMAALISAAALVPGVMTVDPNPWICPRLESCPAVIGNVLVYRAQSHLTRTYVTTLTPMLASALWDATGGLFGQPVA